jgi:hypothetical protein
VEEIDHIVLGVQADDAVPPRTVAVVRTVGPYDAEAVKTALHAERVGEVGRKTVYKCKPKDGVLRPVLWFADDRTLVFGLLEKHLEAVPDAPAGDLGRLPAAVRTLLEERLQSAGPAWVVGYSADWRRTGAALLLGSLTEKDVALLGRVHGFALQLQADKPGTLLAAVQCDDEAVALALGARLTAVKPAAAGDLKTAREGSWLLLQLRGDPAAVFKDVGK